MAHQQTSMLSKALHSNFNIPNISLIRLPRIFFSQNRHNLGRKTATLNCCMECTDTNNGQYYEYERQAMAPQPAQYPRPTEIEWTKEICNSVQLIGNVGTPIQIKHLDSGKVLSCTSLAVKKSSTDTFWINLTFWDELAHVAFEHVQKGQQINVSGRLVSDTVEGDDGKQQTYYKVVVSELNFIKRSISPVSLYGDDSDSGKRSKNYGANSTGSVEELWQAFFANPVEWWDNRKNKVLGGGRGRHQPTSVLGPCFHCGEFGHVQRFCRHLPGNLRFANMVESEACPPDTTTVTMTPAEHAAYTQYQLSQQSASPSIAGLAQAGNANALVATSLPWVIDSGATDHMTGKRSKNYGANSTGSVEELWQAFFANPVEWWDNRKNKKSPKYPDFKHKDTGEALWVEGRYNPPWVRSQLSLLDRRMETSPDENANVTNFIVGDDFRSF